MELVDQNGRLLELQTNQTDFRPWTGAGDSLQWDAKDLRASLALSHTMVDSLAEDQLAKLVELVPETEGVELNLDVSACCDRVSTDYYALKLSDDQQTYQFIHLGARARPFTGFMAEHESSDGKKLLKELVKVFP